MPPLTVWFVRASLLHLGMGFTLGAAMLAFKAFPLHPWMWWVRPAHLELLLVGWILQLAMGVAFWILPRFAGGASRGDVSLAWSAFLLLNAGVLMTGLGQLAHLPAECLLGGRLLEWGAAIAFALHAWPRVKAFGG